MDTETFIDRLSGSALPVQRLRPAWIRAAAWLAVAAPPLILIALVDGIRVGPADIINDRSASIEIVAILATAVTAAVSAFLSTVPGVGRKWLLLPVIPSALWLANIGRACVADWTRLGVAGLMLRIDGPCFVPMVLMSIVPMIAMLVMLRRGAPLMPRTTLLLAALAIAALTSFGLRLIHAPDISLMALAWSFAAVMLAAIILSRHGRQVIGWEHLRR